MRNYIILIPARLRSTRLPNKVLKKINGIEVFRHVWLRCKKVCDEKFIYVTTPDEQIINICIKYKINFIKTSAKCLTGTDRIIEVAKKIKKSFYVNVQADEILVSPLSITKIIKSYLNYRGNYIINGYTKIFSKNEFFSTSTPKVVFNKKNLLEYISRSPIPLNKNNKFISANKQVCIYAFPRKCLLKINFNKKSLNEKYEDIEILRFLDNSFPIKMVKVNGSEIAIDTIDDFNRAKFLLEKKNGKM
jgi:3-deoxy-manno-octulosonate cytidylyltransferase (CMP-KDO synthetase)